MSSLAERQLVYGTKRWRSLRALVLKRDGWLCNCAFCADSGDTRPAELVHHIRPWQQTMDLELAFDIKNLIAVSRHCHSKLHDSDGSLTEESDWDRAVQQLL